MQPEQGDEANKGALLLLALLLELASLGFAQLKRVSRSIIEWPLLARARCSLLSRMQVSHAACNADSEPAQRAKKVEPSE